jgi:low temperature requirement protein LtrA
VVALLGDEDKERHSSWLENFYDLIFAIVVAQLAIGLNENISAAGYLGFVFLFVPVFWSWLGVTFYNTRFETDSLQHRLLTLLQMAAAAFMAVSVIGGLGNNSQSFALSYATVRTILVIEYLLTGKHVRSARPLTRLYSRGFMATTILWFVSAFIPPPYRFYLWFIGLVVDIAIPIILTLRTSNRFAPHIYHLPDRFGAFTIIVLGVSILAFVDNIATHDWTAASVLSAALSLGVDFCIWWIYFDSIDGSAIRAFRSQRKIRGYFAWLYAHFPLLIGIVGFGVSIEHIVLSRPDVPLAVSDKWLMCGSMAICLLSLAIIRLSSVISRPATQENHKNTVEKRQATYSIVAAGIIVLFAAVTPELLPLYTILVIALIMAVLVLLDIRQHPFHRSFKSDLEA